MVILYANLIFLIGRVYEEASDFAGVGLCGVVGVGGGVGVRFLCGP